MAKWVFDIPDEVVGVVVPQLREVIEYEAEMYEFRASHPAPSITTHAYVAVVGKATERPPLVLEES